jgi:gliding motility-associated-like protein
LDSATLTVQDYTIAGISGTQTVGSTVTIPLVGEITILANGSLTFVPVLNYNGTVPTITYTLTDGVFTDTADIVVTVTAVNDTPLANNDTNANIPSTAGATAINTLTATDSDGTIATYTILSLPTNGTLALSGTAVTVNQVLTPAQVALLTYDPSGIFTGNDTFTFTVTDNNGAIDATPATITIQIINVAPPPPPAPPAIFADTDLAGPIVSNTTAQNVLNVLSNDFIELTPATVSNVVVSTVTADPTGFMTLQGDGTIVLGANIPAGTYTLTYSICEIVRPTNCTTATVTIIVDKPSIALVKTAKFNDENGDGYSKAGETITYSFEVTNTGNTILTNVTISDPLPGVVMSGFPLTLGIGESNSTHFQGVYTIKQSDINSGSISNQATVYGTAPSGLVVEDKSDDSNLVNDNPTVLSVSGCAVKVFNAVSPDGNGQNDRFYILGLECYPENSIEIFNRWGVLVFERDQYNNEDKAFRGISEGRVTLEKSSELPVGTYFYILKYKDSGNNSFEKSGYLYLNRK